MSIFPTKSKKIITKINKNQIKKRFSDQQFEKNK